MANVTYTNSNMSTFSMLRYRSSTYMGTAAHLKSQIDTDSWEPVEAEKVVSSAAHAVQCTTTKIPANDRIVVERVGWEKVYESFTVYQWYYNNKYQGKVSVNNNSMSVKVKIYGDAVEPVVLNNAWKDLGGNPIDCIMVSPENQSDGHLTVTLTCTISATERNSGYTTSTTGRDFTYEYTNVDKKGYQGMVGESNYIALQNIATMRLYNEVWTIDGQNVYSVVIPAKVSYMHHYGKENLSIMSNASTRPWAKTEWPEA